MEMESLSPKRPGLAYVDTYSAPIGRHWWLQPHDLYDEGDLVLRLWAGELKREDSRDREEKLARIGYRD